MSRICVRDSHIGRRLYQQIYKDLAPGEGGKREEKYVHAERAREQQPGNRDRNPGGEKRARKYVADDGGGIRTSTEGRKKVGARTKCRKAAWGSAEEEKGSVPTSFRGEQNV